MADLKPCPFCGGKAEIERYGTPRQSTIYQCEDCSCFLETGEEFNHGRQWNDRSNKDQWDYEGAMSDLDSVLDVLIKRINGEADLESAAEWVRLNYPEKAKGIK